MHRTLCLLLGILLFGAASFGQKPQAVSQASKNIRTLTEAKRKEIFMALMRAKAKDKEYRKQVMAQYKLTEKERVAIEAEGAKKKWPLPARR
jgi:hypothetical protein